MVQANHHKQERQKSHHRRSSSSSSSSSSQHHLAHQMLLALGLASMRKHRPCGYYREVPVVTEGGKNVRCTVSRTIPATGKAPERTVECVLALTYRRQGARIRNLRVPSSSFPVGKTVGAISCTTMTLFTKCYPPPAWHAYKQYRPGAENNC